MGHIVHVGEPLIELYVPGGQKPDGEVNPVVLQNVAGGQDIHIEAPFSGENCPRGQARHADIDDCPVRAE